MKFAKMLNKILLAVVIGFSLIAVPSITPGQQPVAAAATNSSSKAAKVVSFAKSLRGKVKYKFGVNNPSKYIFDCSSFTKYVFAKQGVKLPWSSKAQSKKGKYVSKSNLKPGDLVFFSVSRRGQVNHVGIYIGGGKFIHNTTGKKVNGVIISKLSDYSHRYVTARRVL